MNLLSQIHWPTVAATIIVLFVLGFILGVHRR